ncbi:N-acetyltransferase [Marinilabilia rubra]|uniref:GNAT family N-acetyltransferase n=1 Tax=Marinilabilia rubra TaxID=2162893 RepID=A0A2U2B470_9BACT|nr:N-acetyltransferase [Marinilabilia rubra]PWD97871.1 GNAT family N-acetyltransferase [Marinilabilia rubra]
MEEILSLSPENIDKEHICCAFSDKKCKESYELKKDWLKKEFENGYVFRRIDARAKVFIEYGPAEKGWVPVDAPGYLLINCFWVSGKYKGNGYGKELLRLAVEDAKKQGKVGLVTVTGTKKFHFMSDPKWLLRQGFEETQKLSSGFSLLTLKLEPEADDPKFNESALSGVPESKDGLVVYYSNRCPFSEYHVKNSLKEAVDKRNLPLRIVKLESMEQARSCPSPATIFSLFYNGKFITTDISACMDSRFDKVMSKAIKLA